jgi:threonine aldolase
LTGLGFRLPWPCEANEVFAILPRGSHDALQSAGAHYYEWDAALLPHDGRPDDGETFLRLICSFATTAASVDSLLAIAATGRLR